MNEKSCGEYSFVLVHLISYFMSAGWAILDNHKCTMPSRFRPWFAVVWSWPLAAKGQDITRIMHLRYSSILPGGASFLFNGLFFKEIAALFLKVDLHENSPKDRKCNKLETRKKWDSNIVWYEVFSCKVGLYSPTELLQFDLVVYCWHQHIFIAMGRKFQYP